MILDKDEDSPSFPSRDPQKFLRCVGPPPPPPQPVRSHISHPGGCTARQKDPPIAVRRPRGCSSRGPHLPSPDLVTCLHILSETWVDTEPSTKPRTKFWPATPSGTPRQLRILVDGTPHVARPPLSASDQRTELPTPLPTVHWTAPPRFAYALFAPLARTEIEPMLRYSISEARIPQQHNMLAPRDRLLRTATLQKHPMRGNPRAAPHCPPPSVVREALRNEPPLRVPLR